MVQGREVVLVGERGEQLESMLGRVVQWEEEGRERVVVRRGRVSGQVGECLEVECLSGSGEVLMCGGQPMRRLVSLRSLCG